MVPSARHGPLCRGGVPQERGLSLAAAPAAAHCPLINEPRADGARASPGRVAAIRLPALCHRGRDKEDSPLGHPPRLRGVWNPVLWGLVTPLPPPRLSGFPGRRKPVPAAGAWGGFWHRTFWKLSEDLTLRTTLRHHLQRQRWGSRKMGQEARQPPPSFIA